MAATRHDFPQRDRDRPVFRCHQDALERRVKPADLHVEQPTRFELVINLKTAKALGITIPPALLIRANEVGDRMMDRRTAIIGLGGLTAAWPLAVRAQQPIPLIGFLSGYWPDEKFGQPLLAAFRQGLAEAGFVEGKNVTIEYRWAKGQYEQLPALAADLVRRRVSVIATSATPAAVAAKAATTTIPVVFTLGSDPVRIGLVASLALPGGNLTGATRLTVEAGPKRLELMHEMVPAAALIALLINPTSPDIAEAQTRDIEAAARALGLKFHLLKASNEREIDEAFATVAQLRVGALLIAPDALFNSRSAQLGALTVRHRLPTIHSDRQFVDDGGLISYGGGYADTYRIAGGYVGRILKGEKPAVLPVQQSTKLVLFINLKTAKALGLTIPPTLLLRADEVID